MTELRTLRNLYFKSLNLPEQKLEPICVFGLFNNSLKQSLCCREKKNEEI